MSELDTLRPVLEAIAADELQEPNLPVVVALQAGSDLHATIHKGDTWNRLLAVGVDPAKLAALPLAVAATRQAQSEWTVLRDRGKAHAQRDRQLAGAVLRAELVATCRWNFRADALDQAVLDEIEQGVGVPELVQGLLDLAMLIARHEGSLEGDETFDATQAEVARMLASDISAGLAERCTPADHDAAKALRDRAFTYMNRLIGELREAGRHAFRMEPRQAMAFTSEHRRHEQRKARRRAALRNAAESRAAGNGTSTAAAE